MLGSLSVILFIVLGWGSAFLALGDHADALVFIAVSSTLSFLLITAAVACPAHRYSSLAAAAVAYALSLLWGLVRALDLAGEVLGEAGGGGLAASASTLLQMLPVQLLLANAAFAAIAAAMVTLFSEGGHALWMSFSTPLVTSVALAEVLMRTLAASEAPAPQPLATIVLIAYLVTALAASLWLARLVLDKTTICSRLQGLQIPKECQQLYRQVTVRLPIDELCPGYRVARTSVPKMLAVSLVLALTISALAQGLLP